MRRFFSFLSLIFLSLGAAAAEMPAANYQCAKDPVNGLSVGAFYLRADGSSKRVRILKARKYVHPYGVEGCYLTSYEWLDSHLLENDAICCPYGSN